MKASNIAIMCIVIFINNKIQAQNKISYLEETNDSIYYFKMIDIEKKAKDDSNKVFIKIFNVDMRGDDRRLTIEKCINNYNISISNLYITNYVGRLDRFKIKVTTSQNNNEDITLRRSKLFLFTSNSKVLNALEKNRVLFNLEKYYDNNNGVVTFITADISSQEDFCWKLNQIIHFFESNKELFKEEEKPTEKVEEKNKFSINLSSAALLSGKIKSSEGPYSNQLGINQQPMRFAIDFQYWMNNFRLGLGYAYSSFQFNNSLADSSYSTTWNSSYLGASNQLNVSYKNIQEKISFQNNNLYLLAGYSIPFSNNKLRVDIDASFQYSLPFVVNSKLANGEFTYRAQVNGIEDEMMNIPELGLVENDLSSRGRESNFKMHGIGFNIGSNLVYSYKNFDIKFGLGYNYNSYTNEKYNEKSRMTELVGDYKASLLSSKTISAQFFMLQLALGYTIK